MESFAKKILNGYLGMYIEGLDSLDISNISDFTLTDLRLRKDILDEFALPVVVHAGYLDRLKVCISLSDKPSVIEISDLYMIAEPKGDVQLTQKEILEGIWKTKQRILKFAELSEGESKKKSWNPLKKATNYVKEKASAKFLANLTITVKNIHIRYQSPDPLPYSFGITLEDLCVKTTDEQKTPKKAGNNDKIWYKVAAFQSLSVYWNYCSHSPTLSSKQDTIQFLKSQIHCKYNPPIINMKYILPPTDGHMFIKWNNNFGNTIPKADIHFHIPTINLLFNQLQYKEIQSFVEFVHRYTKSCRYLRYRPIVSLEENPLLWWIYVLRSMKEKKSQRSWGTTRTFIRDRDNYIKIWMKKLDKKKLSDIEKNYLEGLEKKHDIDNILLFRQIASKKAMDGEKIKMSKQQKRTKVIQEIRNTDLDEKFAFHFHIDEICGKLLNSNEDIIVQPVFSGLNLNMKILESGQIETQSTVQNINVTDYVTKGSIFPQIVKTFQASERSPSNTPFYESRITIPPNISENGLSIMVNTQKVQFVFAPLLIQSIAEFFKPDIEETSLNDMELEIFLKLQELKYLAQRKVNQVLQSGNLIIGADIRISNPCVLFSPDLTNLKSPLFNISLGNLSVISEDLTLKKQLIQKVGIGNSTKIAEISKEDYPLMFTRYDLKLTDICVCKSTIDYYFDSNSSEDYTIVDPFTMNGTANICRILDPHLPLIDFSISAPPVYIHISPDVIVSSRLMVDSLMEKKLIETTGDTSSQLADTYLQYKKAEIYWKILNDHMENLPESVEYKFSFNADEINIELDDNTIGDEMDKFNFQVSLQKLQTNVEGSSFVTNANLTLQGATFESIKNETKSTLIRSSYVNRTNLSNELQNILVNNDSSLISVNWRFIPEESPLSKEIQTSHSVNISCNQLVFVGDIVMIDGLIRLAQRTLKKYEEIRNKPADIQKALGTSKQVIRHIVYDKKQESLFVDAKFNVNSIILLIPTPYNRYIETAVTKVNCNLSGTKSLETFKLNGSFGTVFANLPLTALDSYFPHIVLLRGPNSKQCDFSCSVNLNDKVICGSFELCNPTIEIPCSMKADSSLKFDLGLIGVQIKIEDDIKRLNFSANNISITHLEAGSYPFSILEPCNFNLEIIKDYFIHVNVSANSIASKISEKQFAVFTDVGYGVLQAKEALVEYIEVGSILIKSAKRAKPILVSIDSEKEKQYGHPKVILDTKIKECKFQYLKLEDNQLSPLAKISVKGISFITTVYKKTKIITSNLEISDITLSDSRTSSENRVCKELITQRLEYDKKVYRNHQWQFKLGIEHIPNGSTSISLELDRTYFLLVFDFWADVLLSILPLKKYLERITKSLPEESKQESSSTQQLLLHAEVTITHPELCIVEDATSLDSSAFILRASQFVTEFNSLAGGSVLNVMTNGIQIGKRKTSEQSFIPLILPFDASVANAKSTGDNSDITNIIIEPIDATFSVRDYNLLLSIYNIHLPCIKNILNTLQSTKVENDSSLIGDQTKKLVQKAHSQLKNMASEKPIYKEQKKLIDITVKSAQLVLINDAKFKSRYNPVLMFHLDSGIITVDWKDDVKIISSFSLSAEYYNIGLEVWEPLLEPWLVSLALNQIADQTRLDIRGQELNINVSHSLIESLKVAVEVFQTPIDENGDNINEKYHSPYYIENHSGLPLLYATNYDSCFTRLHSGKRKPLLIDSNHAEKRSNTAAKWKEREIDSHQIIHLRLEDNYGYYDKQANISFNRTGARAIKLNQKRINTATVDVKFYQGSKFVTIRSNTIIHNHCDICLYVMVSAPPNHNGKLLSVEPGKTLFVPIVYVETGEFSIAPPDSYVFSPPIPLQSSGVLGSILCEGNDVSDYYVWVSIEQKSQDRIFHLLPPITVINELPIPIECVFQYSDKKTKCDHSIIESKKSVAIHLANRNQELEYQGILNLYGNSQNYLPLNADDKSEVSTLVFKDDSGREFLLRAENIADPITAARKITFYSDFWIINRTGLKLLYAEPGSNYCPGQDEERDITLQGDPRGWYKHSKSFTEPFLYSKNAKRIPLCMQVAHSEWSIPVELSAEGCITCLSVKGSKADCHCYELSVTINRQPEHFWRTQLVTIVPRFLLINETSYDILYRQSNSDESFSLHSKEQLPFHWTDTALNQLLQVNIDPIGQNYHWSSSFPIHELNTHPLRLRKKNGSNESVILSVQVTLEKNSNVTLVIIKHNEEYPDLLIDNQLPFSIVISQKGCAQSDQLAPHQKCEFAWDSLSEQVVQLHILEKTFSYTFQTFMKETISIPAAGGNYNATVSIVADGPTKVLRLTSKGRSIDTNTQSVIFEEEEFLALGDELHLENIISLHIDNIGISVINSHPEEFLYCSVAGIDVELTTSENYISFQLKIQSCQLDNQLPLASYPIFFYPTPTENENFFQLLIIKNTKMKSVNYFRIFYLSMEDMNIKLGEELLEDLVLFGQSIHSLVTILPLSSISLPKEELESNQIVSEYYTASAETMQQMKMFFFDQLIINPIKLSISTHSGTGSAKFSKYLPMRGKLLGNIDGAIIEFKRLTLTSPFASKDELITRISQYYTQELLRQFYKIIGAAEIFGNPISLISTMGTGVYDFINEPAQAIIENPANFGLGFKKGTSSLLHRCSYGIASTSSRLTGGIAHLVTFFTFDDNYQKKWAHTFRNAREQPVGAIDGFHKAAKNAGSGVVEGVVGIVNSPIQGAKSGGISGLLWGTAKGTIGGITKPFASVLGSTSLMLNGISTSFMNWEAPIGRYRLPRYIGEDGILVPYNQEQAAGHLLLQNICDGKYINEWYRHSFKIKENNKEGLLIISNLRILIVCSGTTDSPFDKIRGLQLQRNKILILHTFVEQKSWMKKDVPYKFITPFDANETFDIYEQILMAIRAYRDIK